MKKSICLIILIGAWLLAGCQADSTAVRNVSDLPAASNAQVVDDPVEAPTVPPTETPVPPSATPIPPTNTPVPPTDTPLPPTEAPLPETNQDVTEVLVTDVKDLVGTWLPEDGVDYVLTFQEDGLLLHYMSNTLKSQGRGEFDGEIYYVKSITTGYEATYKVYLAKDGDTPLYLRFEVVEDESWYREYMWTGRNWLWSGE